MFSTNRHEDWNLERSPWLKYRFKATHKRIGKEVHRSHEELKGKWQDIQFSTPSGGYRGAVKFSPLDQILFQHHFSKFLTPERLGDLLLASWPWGLVPCPSPISAPQSPQIIGVTHYLSVLLFLNQTKWFLVCNYDLWWIQTGCQWREVLQID